MMDHIQHHNLRQALAIWENQAPVFAGLPGRSWVSPHILGPEILPNICIIECQDRDGYIRLAGTGLYEKWGRDLTGSYLRDLPRNRQLVRLRRNLEEAVHSARPAFFYDTEMDHLGHRELRVENLVLPFYDDRSGLRAAVYARELMPPNLNISGQQPFAGGGAA